MAKKVILPLIQTELHVFVSLGERGSEELLSLIQEYVALVRAAVNRISECSSED